MSCVHTAPTTLHISDMPSRKPFIDKKRATRFTLTRRYVDSDDEAGAGPRHKGAQHEENVELDPDLAEMFGMARYVGAPH